MPKRKIASDLASSSDLSSAEFWICARCTLQNPSRRRRCDACQVHRPIVETSAENLITSSAVQSPPRHLTVSTWLRKRRRSNCKTAPDNHEVISVDVTKECNSKEGNAKATKSATSSYCSETDSCTENIEIEEHTAAGRTDEVIAAIEAIVGASENKAARASFTEEGNEEDLDTAKGQCKDHFMAGKSAFERVTVEAISVTAEQVARHEATTTPSIACADPHDVINKSIRPPSSVEKDDKQERLIAGEQCIEKTEAMPSTGQVDNGEKESIGDDERRPSVDIHSILTLPLAIARDSTSLLAKTSKKTPGLSDKGARQNRVEFFYTPASQSQRDETEANAANSKASARTPLHKAKAPAPIPDTNQDASMQTGNEIARTLKYLDNQPCENSLECHSTQYESEVERKTQYSCPKTHLSFQNSLLHNPLQSEQQLHTISVNNDRTAMREIINLVAESGPLTAIPVAFSTAGSGSVVKVSELGLKKANTLFDCNSSPLPSPTGDQKASGKASTLAIFSTAGSGSVVEVCLQGLKKANSLFDCDSSPIQSAAPADQDAHGNKSTLAMFSTAGSGSVVGVSEHSLRKANSLFDCNSSPIQPAAPVDQDAHGNKSTLAMFSTAGSGSVVGVSEHSLRKANSLFDCNSSPIPPVCANQNDPGNMSTLASFATAGSGSVVQISEQGLKKANTLFDCNSCPLPSPTGDQKASGKASALTIFSTAGSGSVVKVSLQGLKKANSLFDCNSSPIPSTAAYQKDPGNKSTLAAFPTAGSGSVVQISEHGLRKANSLFDCDPSPIPPAATVGQNQSTLAMFSTAGSGSVVEVSEHGLRKASSLFDCNASPIQPAAPVDQDAHGNKSTLAMFSTAGSGSVVEVSEHGLRKASSLFDCNASPLPPLIGDPKASGNKSALALFSTAGSGLPVEVSEIGLRKANSLFDCKSSSLPLSGIGSTLASFSTAGSGSVVEVSEQGLKTANSLFACNSGSLSTPATNHFSSQKGSTLAMFSTAGSGSIVDVSEQGLKKANSLFDCSSIPLPTLVSDSKVSGIGCTLASFSTAGFGSVVEVSEDGINKASALFTANKSPLPKAEHCTSSGKGSTIASFSTAGSGAAVEVSEQGLSIANAIFVSGAISTTEPEIGSFANTPNVPTSLTAGSDDKNGMLNDSDDMAKALFADATFFGEPKKIKSARFLKSSSPDGHGYAKEKVACSACLRLPCVCCFSAPIPTINAVTPFKQTVSSPSHLSPTPIGAGLRQKSHGPARVSLCPTPLSFSTSIPKISCSSSVEKGIVEDALKYQVHQRVKEPVESGEDECYLVADFVDAQRMGHMADLPTDYLLTGLSDVVLHVNSTSGPNIRYDIQSHLPTYLLPPSYDCKETCFGTFHDFRIALASCGCNTSIVTDKWLANHLRWIVWTLASFERKFFHILAGRCLSYSHVIEKLKSRYDRETKDAFRSPLRSVLNRDVSSQRLIILCVSRIDSSVYQTKRDCDIAEIELTDGWYAVRAIVDRPLVDFIQQTRIRVGTKLLLSGATLRGFDEGVDPLDSSYDTFDAQHSPALMISTNSCRIAKWNAKLGFVPIRRGDISASEGLLRIRSISDLLENGGRAPLIDLVVLRRDPLMFLQKHDNCANSSMGARVLSEHEESERLRLSENSKLDVVDQHADLVREQCLKSIDDAAPHVWKQMMNHHSPSSFYEELDSSDRRVVDKWTEDRSSMLHSRLVKEIEQKISELGKDTLPSSSFLRLLVQTKEDYLSNSTQQTKQATLTIWNPNEEQLDEIKENVTLRVKNTEVKHVRFNGLLQLSGGSCCVLKDNASGHNPNFPRGRYSSLRFSTFFRLFVNSSKQMVDRTTTSGLVRENIVGIVLSLDCRPSDWTILLSDETGKLMRVEGDNPLVLEEFKNGLAEVVTDSPRINLQEDFIAVAAFQNIIIAGIDMQRACLVGRYTSESSFVAPPPPREMALRKWFNSPRGRPHLLQAICSFEVCPYQSSKAVVGYICGMHLVPSKELLLEVDLCGQSRTFVLPLSLLLSLSEPEVQSIYFTEKNENQMEQFRKLGQILRSRKSLYSFGTCPAMSDCGVDTQITSIQKTSSLALATLYTALD